jgi:hypothetical protein
VEFDSKISNEEKNDILKNIAKIYLNLGELELLRENF